MSTTQNGSTSEAEILEAIRNYEAPAITTAQIGREVGITRQGAEYRLNRMEPKYEELHTEKMEGARVWFLKDNDDIDP
jgi:hypothetical protein